MRATATQCWILAIAAAGLVTWAGCSTAREEASKSSAGASSAREERKVVESVADDAPAGPTDARLVVFAEKAFYRERPEPEEVLSGILRHSEARTGPDTRDMPLRFVTGEKAYPVYVSGFDLTLLAPFVDRPVEITGRRVDLTPEGFEVEVWIGSIAPGR